MRSPVKAVEERRAIIRNIFKDNPGTVLSSKDIALKLNLKGVSIDTIKSDIAIIKKTDTCIQTHWAPSPRGRGFVYVLPAASNKMPVMIDNKINVSKNAEGVKDSTAEKAIRSVEPLAVYPGGVYSCTTNKGDEALYLTVRGPFMCNDVEKVTVVPVYRPIRSANERDEILKFSGKNKGITLDVYPYDISTKPTKYFKRLEDEILPCDLKTVKIKIREFLDIPKVVEYKTIEKTVEVEKPVEVERVITEKVEIPVWPKDIEKELQHQIDMWKCKAQVYEDAYKTAIEAFANARKGE